jgi:HlyD family secretion protein
MKKISYYLIFIVAVGALLVSVWTYQRYFKEESPALLSFTVERGGVREVVQIRGQVVPQKNFDLEFPLSGVVEGIFVTEGKQVNLGDPLMSIETTDLELEIKRIKAQQAQAEADFAAQKAKLAELKMGTRPEEIQVQDVRIASAKIALEDARRNLMNTLQDAYTKSDDAVRNRVDQFISNPRTSNPKLNFVSTNPILGADIEWQRAAIESGMRSWKLSLDQMTMISDLGFYTTEASGNLDKIKSFLDQVALAVNSITQNSNLSQATIDAWKSDVVIARTNINAAIVNLTAAEERSRASESNLAVMEEELVVMLAGTVAEQVTAQEAQVKQAEANIQNYQAQIAIVQEKIKKSTLYAPISSKVVTVWFERQELFKPGNIAITLETSGHKIQAEISELEIGRVKEVDGTEVLIQLDAFPDLKLKGTVVSIEPREVIREGDKYYRANIFMEPHGSDIRSGMNADLVLLISSKEDVLKIPEFAVYKKEDKEFVLVLAGDQQKEVEIRTGISDGESIEVVEGLAEGQIVVVSAD